MGRETRESGGTETTDMEGGVAATSVDRCPEVPSRRKVFYVRVSQREDYTVLILLGNILGFRLCSAFSGKRKHVNVVEPSQTTVSLLSRHPIQFHQVLHVCQETPD